MLTVPQPYTTNMQDTPPTDPPLLGAAIQSEHETEDERGDRTFDGMNKDLAIIMHQAP